jgi:hypothetical protein
LKNRKGMKKKTHSSTFFAFSGGVVKFSVYL